MTWSFLPTGLAGGPVITGSACPTVGQGWQTVTEHRAGPVNHGGLTVCGFQLSLQWPGLPWSQSSQRLFISIAKYGMGNLVKLRDPKPRIPPSPLKALHRHPGLGGTHACLQHSQIHPTLFLSNLWTLSSLLCLNELTKFSILPPLPVPLCVL